MPEVDLFGDNNVPQGTELYDKRIGKIQAEIHNYLRQGVVPPAIQQVLNKLDNISIDADTVNLNTDQLEAKLDTLNGLLTTLQTDTALVKVSASNVDLDLGSPSESAAASDTANTGLIGLFKRLLQRITTLIPANLTVSSTRLLVDGSGVTQPVSGTVTAAQATHANLKAQAQILDSSGNQLTYAATGTAGSPASDVVTVQGTSGGTPLPVRPRNGTITVTTGTTSATANTSVQALASNASRQYLLIQNISDTDMYFNFGTSATTSNLLITKSGGGIVFEAGFVPTDSINVTCSSASKSYYILSA